MMEVVKDAYANVMFDLCEFDRREPLTIIHTPISFEPVIRRALSIWGLDIIHEAYSEDDEGNTTWSCTITNDEFELLCIL